MIRNLSRLSLVTERLTIRAATLDDLEKIHQIHRVAAVNRYLPYETWTSMDDARAWYDNTCERRKNQDAEQFVLMHAEDLVGTMIVFNYSEQTQSAEIGYVLGQPFWGKGYMQEALTEFIPSVKSALEITQLCANVDRENTKSANLLARLNFAYTRSDTEPDGVLLDTFTRKFY